MDQSPLPPPPQEPQFVDYAGIHPPPGGEGKAIASMVLGIVGLFMWFCCAMIGLTIGIVGLVLGIQANQQVRRSQATAGIIMCTITIVLALVNMIWGIYLAMTGQNPLMNMFNQQGAPGI